MKGAGHAVFCVCCGLPSALMLLMAVSDRVHGGRTFSGSAFGDLPILLEVLTGFGFVVLMPLMWLAWLGAKRRLAPSAFAVLTAFAAISTLGVLNYWVRFIA
jgi:hypothetical protein